MGAGAIACQCAQEEETDHELADNTTQTLISIMDLTGCGKTQFLFKIRRDLAKSDVGKTTRRMLKMAVQLGRSERRGEAYPCGTLNL
jgi:hypothetical protein